MNYDHDPTSQTPMYSLSSCYLVMHDMQLPPATSPSAPTRIGDVRFSWGPAVPETLAEDIAKHARISVNKGQRAFCSNVRGGRLKLGETRLAVLQWIAESFKWKWRDSVSAWRPDDDPEVSQGTAVIQYCCIPQYFKLMLMVAERKMCIMMLVCCIDRQHFGGPYRVMPATTPVAVFYHPWATSPRTDTVVRACCHCHL
jgi:hypothetical protein